MKAFRIKAGRTAAPCRDVRQFADLTGRARRRGSKCAIRIATNQGLVGKLEDRYVFNSLAIEHSQNALNVQGKPHLTNRERKLLALLANGLDDGEIASVLKKSERDVVASVCGLLAKTGTRDRIELVLFGLANSEAEP